MPNPKLPDGGSFKRTPQSFRAEGLRVRFSRVQGQTPKDVLKKPLILPVVIGEEFTVTEDAAFTDYETVGDGEFSQARGGPSTARNLRVLDSLETLTLDWARWARWMTNPLATEQLVRKELYAILRSRKPMEILATLQLGQGAEELRMKATIRSIGRTLKKGETDTRYYVLGIKEWREDSVARRGAGTSKKDLPAKKKLTAKTTLYSVAREFYDLHTIDAVVAARQVRSKNGLGSWGLNEPIVKTKKFKVGDSITVPEPTGTYIAESGGVDVGAGLIKSAGLV